MVSTYDQLPTMSDLSKDYVLPTDYNIDDRDLCDLEMLATGAFAPLTGYMNKADYQSCLENMRLASGAVWTIPIVFPVKFSALTLRAGDAAAPSSSEPHVLKIRNLTNAIMCELVVTDVFKPDLNDFMVKVLGSDDTNHPYAKYLLQNHKDCVYVGGEIRKAGPFIHFDYNKYRHSPEQVKAEMKAAGAEVVVGFQTRNPLHCSHFQLTLEALREAEAETGKKATLLLTPAVGPTQPGDVDYPVRVRCYEKILPHYERTPGLVLIPLAMRMAGPREAVWHAIIRRNYGCTHFIVGRDHAGPSTKKKDGTSFYGPYEAHETLKSLAAEIGIKPIFGRNIVYVGPEFGEFVREDRMPEGAVPRTISGTAFRKMLVERTPVPEWFSFPEVVEELHRAYKPRQQCGLCVYFTGLPCAGKSTLANALEAMFMENPKETRKVTVLDADVIRTHLSKGIGFSREDRQTNVRRIGYVASEICKHGGICLVANIAPYLEDRMHNRHLIESVGAYYVEVYVSTPLDVCELRDIKELYKKARMGVIKQFTGISDTYEAPENAEIVVNSSVDIEKKAEQVHDYLKREDLAF